MPEQNVEQVTRLTRTEAIERVIAAARQAIEYNAVGPLWKAMADYDAAG